MSLSIEPQQWHLLDGIPDPDEISQILERLLDRLGNSDDFEMSVRLVDETEGAELNHQYRQKVGATNILSFPYEPLPGIELPLLGDLVICAPIVHSEAIEQNKTIREHFIHLMIHGTLHLLGYDHLTEQEAEEMEQIEIQALELEGVSNPYEAIDPGQ